MAKYVITLLALCFVPLSTAAAHDDYWGTIERGTSTRIGNHTFYQNGTSSTRIGNSKYYSDGITETTIGNHTFRSDGHTSTRIGNHTFRSDSTNGVDIGTTHFYRGGRLTPMGGYTFRDR